MPIYYLDLNNSIGLIRDEEGRDLPDEEAARSEALRGARALIAEDALRGRIDLSGSIDVLGSDRRLLFTIRFADAVDILR